MTGAITISTFKSREAKPFIVVSLVYLAIFLVALRQYVQWQSINFILGLVALVFIAASASRVSVSYRYGWMSAVTALLCLLIPVKTLLYFSIIFAFFFLLETSVGKTGILSLVVVAVMSPLFQFVTSIISFKARLTLSSWAVQIMNVFGGDAVAHGNVIEYRGTEFAVDPACMGLNMTVTSLLFAIIILAFLMQQSGRQLRSHWALLLLLISVLLNIGANLARILLLVLFNIPPASALHEFTGIVCLLAYVLIPAVVIAKFLLRSRGHQSVVSEVNKGNEPARKFWLWHRTLGLVLVLAAGNLMMHDWQISRSNAPLRLLPGYQSTRISADIIKLENRNALIYIKSIQGFFSADHNPGICWKGSGYEFVQVEEKKIAGRLVWTAIIKKGNDKLVTAWWYDNGQRQTTSQAIWRWDMLRGSLPYAIVNVTSSDKTALENELKEIFSKRPFDSLLKPSFSSRAIKTTKIRFQSPPLAVCNTGDAKSCVQSFLAPTKWDAAADQNSFTNEYLMP